MQKSEWIPAEEILRRTELILAVQDGLDIFIFEDGKITQQESDNVLR